MLQLASLHLTVRETYSSSVIRMMGQAESNSDESEVTLQNIQDLYRKFASECPSGNLHLHEFKRIFGVSSSSSEEELAYVEIVFHSFDTNKDNKIDFMEFVAAVNLILRGKLEDKLRWSFKVYDRDGNGSLTRQEVRHIIKIINKIKRHEDPNVSENLDSICQRLFELVDKNHDDQISLEEFIEGAEKDPWVMQQLKLDPQPTDWFVKQMNKNS